MRQRSCERPLPAQWPQSIGEGIQAIGEITARVQSRGRAEHSTTSTLLPRFITSEKRKGNRKTFTRAIYALYGETKTWRGAARRRGRGHLAARYCRRRGLARRRTGSADTFIWLRSYTRPTLPCLTYLLNCLIFMAKRSFVSWGFLIDFERRHAGSNWMTQCYWIRWHDRWEKLKTLRLHVRASRIDMSFWERNYYWGSSTIGVDNKRVFGWIKR